MFLQLGRRHEAGVALRLRALVRRLAWKDSEAVRQADRRKDRQPVSLSLSPVCLRAWAMSEDETEKDMPHRSHWYGRSPVCRRLW